VRWHRDYAGIIQASLKKKTPILCSDIDGLGTGPRMNPKYRYVPPYLTKFNEEIVQCTKSF
jgi:hypothetical protein